MKLPADADPAMGAETGEARLRPGLVLLRRDRHTWQAGLDRAVADVVTAPDGHEPTPARLAADPRTRHLVSTETDRPPGDLAPAEWAALLQRDPERAAGRAALRAAATVDLRADPAYDGAPALLAAAGVRCLQPGGARTAGTLALLLADGEVDRADLDGLVRAQTPHLVVRLVDGTVTLGPFVVPGRTACVRCLDEHAAVEDPAQPSLVAQHLARWPERDPRRPAPRDRALLALATAWAVRDVVTFAEGERPTTWSSTVRLEAGLAGVTSTRWLRHPACACYWQPDQASSATMSG